MTEIYLHIVARIMGDYIATHPYQCVVESDALGSSDKRLKTSKGDSAAVASSGYASETTETEEEV